MPLTLLVALILAFGLGDRGAEGPLPDRLARYRLYELGLGLALIGVLAFALGNLAAWSIRRRRGASPGLRRGLIWGSRGLDLLGLALLAWALEGLEWPRIVAWTFGLRDWLLLDDLLVLLPYLAAQVIAWAGLYPAERALRPSPGYLKHLAGRARQSLGLILPMALLYGLGRDLLGRFWPERAEEPGVQLLGLALMGLLILAIAPAFVRLAWPTRPLPPGPLRTRLERLARRFRFRYSRILVWDTGGLVVNAGVSGALPWFRYVLLTDALIERLDDEQIEAVFGHEIGHVAHRHFLYFGFFFLGSMGVAALIEAAVQLGLNAETWSSGWLADPTTGEVIRWAAALGALGAYFLLVFGHLSRRFERQADVFGCRAVSCGRPDCPAYHQDPNALAVTVSPPHQPCAEGIRVFNEALAEVAALNGLALSAPSWRHGSIARRIGFLETLARRPELARRFQIGVVRLRLALGATLVVASIAAWLVHGAALGL